MPTLISHNCYGLGTGQCVVNFGEYSQLSNPVFVNPVPMYQDFGGVAYQCTWWANARIYQLTGFKMGAWGDGACYGSVAMANGYTVYENYQEALQAKGTLAGLVMSMGTPYRSYANCNNYTDCGALGSSNHVAICEGYDPDSGTIYVSEMWGSVANGDILLNSYSRSSYANCIQWIDLNVEATGAKGGYFKDKFGEFHWPVKPEKDARFPTSSEYQEFCDRLNEAQKEAGVEDPTEFSATQDSNVLTAARFNEYLHLMQESTEGNLRGVDDEIELMEDVQKDDVIYAKHFLQLEDLYNHWMYGNNYFTDDPSIAGQIWNALMIKGFTPVVAAGIMGYMWGESQLDPTIIEGGNSIGFGLCQWSFERRYGDGTASSNYLWGVFPWCEARGLDPYSYSAQIDFMYWEIFNQDTTFQNYCVYGCYAAVCGGSHAGIGGVNGFLNLTDLYEVVWCFTWWFGRPRADVARIQVRYEHALEYYNKYYVNNNNGSGGGATGNWAFPLTYYTGCQCRLGEVYVGASDLSAPNGTEIHAIDGGIVDISWIWQGGTAGNNSYGNFVRIDHGNGWKSLYAHMNSAPLVSYGQSVSQGALLGYVGDTGYSFGNHLHLEIISSDGARHCASEIFGIYCPWTNN